MFLKFERLITIYRSNKMRVFKDDRIEEKLVGEMINIEAGKLLYENGLSTEVEKPPLYPSIENDGITTTIRSSIGFIYLPNSLNWQMIAETLIPRLEEKDKENDYLSNYGRLERRAGQFTAMKAKNSFVKNAIGNQYTIGHKRTFVINTDQTDLGKIIKHNRFTWFVFPISVLVKNIETFESPRIAPITQFVSMIYDINNQLAIEDGVKLDSNITFKHFRVCQHLISFNPLKHELEKEIEEITTLEKVVKEVDAARQALINEKKCPDCKKAFKSKGGLTRHMRLESCIKKKKKLEEQKSKTEKIPCPYCKRECIGDAGLIAHLRGCENAKDKDAIKELKEKRELEQFQKLSTEEKSERIQQLEEYPEYMPQWNDVVYDETQGLALCPKRGAVFELIKYFGRWNIYKKDFENGYVALKEVDKPIYEEDFRNIVIDNGLNPSFDTLNVMRSKQWPNTVNHGPNELCSRCFTPLYGDIYVVLPHAASLSGMAVCPTCMHYEPELWCEDKRIADYVILRVTHPTSINQIIDNTDFHDKKKEVMKQSFTTKSLFVDTLNGDSAIYIGYEPGVHMTCQYIGWTGRIYNYINYTNSTNKFYKSGPKEQLAPMAAEAKIFPIRTIRFA